MPGCNRVRHHLPTCLACPLHLPIRWVLLILASHLHRQLPDSNTIRRLLPTRHKWPLCRRLSLSSSSSNRPGIMEADTLLHPLLVRWPCTVHQAHSRCRINFQRRTLPGFSCCRTALPIRLCSRPLFRRRDREFRHRIICISIRCSKVICSSFALNRLSIIYIFLTFSALITP